ncbi:MAG: type I methionyl aminopeptidase [Thermodesulfobacteriota bacterium]|nr:type I methionyl aminopeptidase [Thermodesulfobacteriota bacterium]
MIIIKTKDEIERMRQANQIIARLFEHIEGFIKPGITTAELDQEAELFIRAHNAIPSFKGYNGFPAAICASVNEEIVHGIPGQRRLKEGDIIGIDVGTIKDGFNGDAARTYTVGSITKEARRLIEATKNALAAGIEQARPGNHLYDISAAVQGVVESAGFSVVRDFVGHGIGRNLHEEPQIPNFGKRGTGPVLKEGMTFAIEPMVNAGSWKVKVLGDGWTAVTGDGSLSAHFENSIAITSNGPDILSV